MYDTDYEVIEQEILDNKCECICNIDRKNIIGLLIRFMDNSKIIDANDDSTLLIQTIKDTDNSEILPRFHDNKPRKKESFTKLECFFSRIDSKKKYWVYFLNGLNSYKIKLIFDLYFDSNIKERFIEITLIYNRNFSNMKIKYNYYPLPALCYYLIDTDLRDLVSFI